MTKYPPISDSVRWKDHHFIIMDKPSGTPVQPDQTGDKSALSLAEIYSKRKLHNVTRLDRPASGLCLFAKTVDDVNYVKTLFDKKTFDKSYLAIVEGELIDDKGSIENFLYHDKLNRKALVSKAEEDGYKLSQLQFKKLFATEKYSVLKVKIETGRFHQIRAQLADYGFPIKGDVKYGARRANTDRSIHLCCYDMEFLPKVGSKPITAKAELNIEDKLWSLTNEYLNGK